MWENSNLLSKCVSWQNMKINSSFLVSVAFMNQPKWMQLLRFPPIWECHGIACAFNENQRWKFCSMIRLPSNKFITILWHTNAYNVTYIPKVNECLIGTQWFMIYRLGILHQLYHLENSVKMWNIFYHDKSFLI